jgi:hypothetical protein
MSRFAALNKRSTLSHCVVVARSPAESGTTLQSRVVPGYGICDESQVMFSWLAELIRTLSKGSPLQSPPPGDCVAIMVSALFVISTEGRNLVFPGH